MFQVDEGVTANFSGLTISGGSTTGYGGGLYNDGGTISLSNVTVSGNAAALGGGLFNTKRGTITVITCAVIGNSATNGGGLYNDDGTTTLTAAAISGNSAVGGGGLFNTKRGTITVITCAVTGNSGSNGGGGLYNYGGTATLSGVTLSGNTAAAGGGMFNTKRGTIGLISCTIGGNTAGAGGGLYNSDATANLSACTISGNTAAVGGGIDNVATASATLEDTIVAANIQPGGSASDIGGDNSDGVIGTYDLIGIGGSGAIAGGTGNIILSDLASLGLAQLGNYGGPTETMALLPGSAAIDTGTAIPGVSTDQRGLPPLNATDIGAFQSQGFIITPVTSSANTAAGTPFTDPLAVTVTAVNPVEPVAGGVMNFSVIPAPDGASASLSAATAIIGSNGIAEVTATANSIVGTYTLMVSAAGAVSPANITLSNLVALTFSGIVSQSLPFGTASATFSGTLANGAQFPEGESVAVTLDGVTQEAAIGGSGAFSTTFDTASIAASITAYTVSYDYTSDGIFADSSTTSSLLITKLTPTLIWASPADITYGTALSATQLDANGSVAGTYTYTPALGTVLSAGTGQILSATFTPTDSTDYDTVSDSVTIKVDAATPDITWANPADITYGTALSATQLDATSSWTVAGVSGTVAGTFAYTPAAGTVLKAGNGQLLSVTFTPTDSTDYKTASGTATINVDKATSTITWQSPGDITYGTALSNTQLDATDPVPGTLVYDPAVDTVLHAGLSQTLSVTFEPTDSADYATISLSVTINVAKADPTIAWANAADITYGTALSATQLDAETGWTVGGVSGAVAGSLTYTPAAGIVLDAATAQTLSVTFTPADSTDYNGTARSVTINVGKATPTVLWANPADIVVGTALSATQLDATTSWTVSGVNAAVAGTFIYTPAAGAVLPPGVGQNLSVTFAPTNPTDYNITSSSVSINVDRATPAITWANPAGITYGTELSTAQLDATASVSGTFAYTPSLSTLLKAGTGQTLSVTFTPTDSTDYNTTSATAKINVDKATPTIVWGNPVHITFGTALSSTELDAGSSSNVGGVNGTLAGTYSYTPAAGTVLPGGAGQTLSVSFAPSDSADYNTGFGTARIDVNPAKPAITWANPADITYGTALSATQLDATASVPGTMVYNPPIGTVLHAGANWGLSVIFTPTDSVDYAVTSGWATINVAKATPTIAWQSPADITFGSALSSTQLNSTPSVPGALTYTPPAGTVLKGGASQPLSVTLAPSDSIDYNAASASVTITVGRATPAIVWYNPIDITAGTTLSTNQLNARATIPGSFAYTPALGTILDADAGQMLSATFTPNDTTDYVSTVATVTINVNNGKIKVGTLTATLDVTDAGGRYDGSSFPASVTIAGAGPDNPPAVSLEDITPTLTYYNSAGTSLGSAPPATAGNYTVVADFPGSTHYSAVRSAPVAFTIAQGTATIALSSSVTSAVFGQSVTFIATVASESSGTPSGMVTFSDGGTALATVALGASGTATLLTSGLALGSNSITATYTGDTNFPVAHSQALAESVAQAGTNVVLVPERVLNNKKKLVSVRLRAEVEPLFPGGGVPTGNVTFEMVTRTKKNTKPTTLGTISLSGGEATLTLKAKTVLGMPIKIVYSGDPDFKSSTASPQTLSQSKLKSLALPVSGLFTRCAFPSALGESFWRIVGALIFESGTIAGPASDLTARTGPRAGRPSGRAGPAGWRPHARTRAGRHSRVRSYSSRRRLARRTTSTGPCRPSAIAPSPGRTSSRRPRLLSVRATSLRRQSTRPSVRRDTPPGPAWCGSCRPRGQAQPPIERARSPRSALERCNRNSLTQSRRFHCEHRRIWAGSRWRLDIRRSPQSASPDTRGSLRLPCRR